MSDNNTNSNSVNKETKGQRTVVRSRLGEPMAGFSGVLTSNNKNSNKKKKSSK